MRDKNKGYYQQAHNDTPHLQKLYTEIYDRRQCKGVGCWGRSWNRQLLLTAVTLFDLGYE